MTKPTPGCPAGSSQPPGHRPSGLLRATVIGAGLLTLAACGARTGNTGEQVNPGGPVRTSVTATTTLTPPPPVLATGQTVPPSQIDYSSAGENTAHTVWQQDGGRTLVVMAEESGCAMVNTEVAEQSATEVKIVLVTVTQTHRVCPLFVRDVPIAAHLDAPLGTRKLILSTRTDQQH